MIGTKLEFDPSGEENIRIWQSALAIALLRCIKRYGTFVFKRKG